VFLLSRWGRAVWIAIEIASSVNLLGRYANWSGSRVSGIMVLMLSRHQLSFNSIHICSSSWDQNEEERKTVILSSMKLTMANLIFTPALIHLKTHPSYFGTFPVEKQYPTYKYRTVFKMYQDILWYFCILGSQRF
jgi:hypothetical protein